MGVGATALAAGVWGVVPVGAVDLFEVELPGPDPGQAIVDGGAMLRHYTLGEII